MASNVPDQPCNSETPPETTALRIKEKRSRGVSIADTEVKSVSIFGDYTPPEPEPQPSSQTDAAEAENPVVGFFRELGGDGDDFKYSDDDEDEEDGRKSFFMPSGSPSPAISVPGSGTSNDAVPGKRTCVVSKKSAKLQSKQDRALAVQEKITQKKRAGKEKAMETSCAPEPSIDEALEPDGGEAPIAVKDGDSKDGDSTTDVVEPVKKKMKKKKAKEDWAGRWLAEKLKHVQYMPDDDPIDLDDDVPLPCPRTENQRKRKSVEAQAHRNKEVIGTDPLFGGLSEFDFAQLENAMMSSDDPFRHLHEQFEIPRSKVETVDWVKHVMPMHSRSIPFVKKMLSGSQRKLEEFLPGPSRNHVSPSELVELLGYAASEIFYHLQRAVNMYSHAYHSNKVSMAEQAKAKAVVKEHEKVIHERDSAIRELEKVRKEAEKVVVLRVKLASAEKAKVDAENARDTAQKKLKEAEMKLMDAEAKLKSQAGGAGEMPIGIYKFWLRKYHRNLNVDIDFAFEHAIGGPWKTQKPTPPAPLAESSGEAEAEDEDEEGASKD